MESYYPEDPNRSTEMFGTPDSQVHDANSDDEDGSRSFFVRALYDFTSSDSSSLSFEKGALIEVLTQLESGWWDGLMGNDVRGWFPSNYVEVISEQEAEMEMTKRNGDYDGKNIDAAESSDFGGLGLGQDFDVLRQLMTGVSPLMDSDAAFEQLAEAGMRSFDLDQRDNSNSRASTSRATDVTRQTPSSTQSRISDVSFSDSSTHTDRTSIAARSNVTSSSSVLRPGPSEKERLRAQTVSVGTPQGRQINAVENRPRAATSAESSQIRTNTGRRSLQKMKKKRENDFWVPRVTERGDIYYLNTRTGAQALDLPDGTELAVEGGGSSVPTSEDDAGSSDHSVVNTADTPPKLPLFGRHTSTIYADGDEGRNRAISDSRPSTATSQRTSMTVKSRRNGIEFMPDPRDVPFPWVPRASDDERTYHYYNRQTHEISNDPPLYSRQLIDNVEGENDSTEEILDIPKRGPRKSRAVTMNSIDNAPILEEDAEVTSISRYADEREAMELQRAMDQSSPTLHWLIKEADNTIARLASIASENVSSDGLSELDRLSTPTNTTTLVESSRLGLAITEVVDTIRSLLYASGSLTVNSTDLSIISELSWLCQEDAPSDVLSIFQDAMTALYSKSAAESSVEPFVAVALQQATCFPPPSLSATGKKINATLSKLVLSARSVIEQSSLNQATRPELNRAQLEKITSYRQRIKEDAMELVRCLSILGGEMDRSAAVHETIPWSRTVQGVLKSGRGVAGIGLEVLGGGSGAGWRANGFVLPTATEAAALRAEASGSYQNPFELTRDARNALSSGKISVRRKPVQLLSKELLSNGLDQQFDEIEKQVAKTTSDMENISVQEDSDKGAAVLSLIEKVLMPIGSLLTALEEIDLATSLDVDGPSTEVKSSANEEYVQSITLARTLLYQFASIKQRVYDLSNLLFVEAQDLASQWSEQSFAVEEAADHGIIELLKDVESKSKDLKKTLFDLLDVSEFQAKSPISGQIGARAKVYGVDNVKLSDAGTKTRAAKVQIGPHDMSRSKSADDRSSPGEEFMDANDEQAEDVMYLGPGLAVPNGPRPASIRGTLRNGLRARSTSVTTGTSVNSHDSGARSSTRKEEDDGDLRNHKVNNKIKRFFGDEPLSLPPTRDSSTGELDASVVSLAKPVEQETPWFLEADYSADDIVMNTNGHVKGATLSALMERLTMHNAFDSNFNTTFLMTYRSFTTTEELLELLIARFRVKEPAGLSKEEHQVWVDRKQMLIRFRIFNVLKTWLESHFYEGEDEVHLKTIENFVLDGMGESPMLATPGKQLIRLIERTSGKGEKMVRKFQLPASTPAPILPKNFRKIKFLDIDPLEMARQLTLMDSRLYNRIRPIECLNKAWSRDNGAEVAKAIRDVISANNKVSGWVSEAILVQEDIKKRASWVKQFVAIADKCYSLNNFSSMMAIYSGLNNASLNRLRRTWDSVNQRHLQMFENMRNILAPTRNFSKYRETLRMLNPPCVPFLGVYLTDLTFIEDGNSDRLKTDERLINFSKRQMTADKIQEIMIYQSTPYNLTPVPSIQKFIEENLIESRKDEELFEQSLRLEPREREDEKIARLLQESGFL